MEVMHFCEMCETNDVSTQKTTFLVVHHRGNLNILLPTQQDAIIQDENFCLQFFNHDFLFLSFKGSDNGTLQLVSGLAHCLDFGTKCF
jgi:hypothetical protein